MIIEFGRTRWKDWNFTLWINFRPVIDIDCGRGVRISWMNNQIFKIRY